VPDTSTLTPVRRRLGAQFRALPDQGEGVFDALVCAYNVEYDIGWGYSELILPGAFDESLRTQEAIPVCWDHAWAGVGPIGTAVAASNADGLYIRGSLFLDLDPMVARIWAAMRAKAVREYSIAFLAQTFVYEAERPYCDQIAQGDLIEATICFRGANPDTQTLDMRSRAAWLEGDETVAKREVIRLRSLLSMPETPEATTDPASDDKPDPTTPKLDAVPKPKASARSLRALFRHRKLRTKLAKLRDAGTDDDDEPSEAELAQALDAVIDAIQVALEAGDTKGALDLAVAADSTSDDLLEAVGAPDDDGIEDLLDSLLDDTSPDGPGDADWRSKEDEARLRALVSTRGGWELFRAAASAPAPSPTKEPDPGGPNA
jgi:HK97 family phage prohead protease